MGDRIYVIAGKDEPLVNARCQELLDELLEPEQRLTGLFAAEGDAVAVADILDELRTTPFLTDKRVVVVRGAEGFISKYREILEGYFEKPSPTGILIMTVSSWDARTRLAKRLPKIGTLLALTPPPRWELPQHLVRHAAEKYQVRLNRDAAEMLVESAGEELTQLYNEIDKLVLFARGEKTIRAEHVQALGGHQRIYGAFEVIDAMMAGNAGEAVRRLRNMFDQDRDAQYSVVGAFAYHVRRMFQAKILLDKRVDPKLIAKQVHVWSNRDRFFAQLQRTEYAQIALFLEELAALDYATKTGQAQVPVAIEQLVLRLARAADPASAARP
jgi:DNA polymerase-3 subunit delta